MSIMNEAGACPFGARGRKLDSGGRTPRSLHRWRYRMSDGGQDIQQLRRIKRLLQKSYVRKREDLGELLPVVMACHEDHTTMGPPAQNVPQQGHTVDVGQPDIEQDHI